MIDLNINKNGDKAVAEYLLKPNDRIDQLTLGMMVNNDIMGFAPVSPVQNENNRYFRYDISGLITVKEYLTGFVKREQLLKTFYGIATTIANSLDYMINWTSFSLDVNQVYINKETAESKLICVPLLTVINDGNLANFFKMILFSTQFDTSENNDYIGILMNFLNMGTFSLDKFIYQLEELLEMEHTEVVEDEDDYVAPEKTVEEKVEEATKEVEEKAEEVEEKVEEAAEEVEEKAEEVTEEVEEKVEEKAEEVIEEVTEEISDDEVAATENDDEEEGLTVPVMTKEELENAEVEKNVSTETEVKTLSPIEELMGGATSEDNKEEEKEESETEASEESVEETTEETEEEILIPLEDLPYLQKTRHGDDKIPITKDIFYVGKAEDVDYQILDDPVVEDKPACIVKHGEDYFLIDLDSPMGIYMDGKMIPVEEEVLINDGARIRFGEYDYIFNLNKK